MDKKELKAITQREYTVDESLSAISAISKELSRKASGSPETWKAVRPVKKITNVSNWIIASPIIMGISGAVGTTALAELHDLPWVATAILPLLGGALFGFWKILDIASEQAEKVNKRFAPKKFARDEAAWLKVMQQWEGVQALERERKKFMAPYEKALTSLFSIVQREYPDKELVVHENGSVEVRNKQISDIDRLILTRQVSSEQVALGSRMEAAEANSHQQKELTA